MPRASKKKEEVKLTPHEEMACRFAALFKTPQGQEVLEDMRKLTIEKPTIVSHAVDGMAMSLMMSVREGENNFFRTIRTLCRKGEELWQARS